MAESHYVARVVWGCFRNDVSPSVSLPNSSWLRSPNPDRRTGCQGPDGVTARQEASRAVQPSHVAHLLSNRYYLGYVTFKGVEYQGRHQPLVPPSMYDSVQAVLKAHDVSGEKTRVHHHYPKGSIFCGDCGSRLCFTLAKGLYPYFYCLGRHQRRTSCAQRYLAVEAVEQAIERHYTPSASRRGSKTPSAPGSKWNSTGSTNGPSRRSPGRGPASPSCSTRASVAPAASSPAPSRATSPATSTSASTTNWSRPTASSAPPR